ncbi:ABC transporter permease [Candidatus Uabimicrobium amorphum]|uniref:ABC transporter permease n=1 Tax=Uabimicrobium amorphum TaxID=2596890 RepID=A0A5S9ITM8_UABAM|nr:ABC-2 family transporter protein [Candidatus Uabimicrobium amorphum]BBM87340.1 ABC transporter permease [Candidatus Uabimicrobium amorphum]
MTRYFRLYLHFLRFSFSKAMEFRVDFFFRIVMDCFFYAINIAFYQVLFLHTSTLGGWNEEQAMIFVAAYILVDALQMTIFSTNLWWFPIFVNRGDLDYYLVRPVSSLFFLSVREFAANSLCNVFIAIGIMIWAISSYSQPLIWWKILLFVLLVVNGTFIYYMVHMLFLIGVFWTHSARGFDSLFRHLCLVHERPDGIFHGATRTVFTTVLPFCLMCSFPARLLFEDFQLSVLLHILITTMLMFFVLRWAWKFSLKAYSSASS